MINRTHKFAEWDKATLAKLLDELRSEDGLDGVGYSEEESDTLVAELEADCGLALSGDGPLG